MRTEDGITPINEIDDREHARLITLWLLYNHFVIVFWSDNCWHVVIISLSHQDYITATGVHILKPQIIATALYTANVVHIVTPHHYIGCDYSWTLVISLPVYYMQDINKQQML